jgi:peptidoglycan/LPS O-acetylase OafA/YrhL
MLPVGLASVPALLGFVRAAPACRSAALLFLGRYSFAIYLFNTPCIGVAKATLLSALSWDGANFLLFAPALLASGLVGPLVLKRFVLIRMPALDRLTG